MRRRPALISCALAALMLMTSCGADRPQVSGTAGGVYTVYYAARYLQKGAAVVGERHTLNSSDDAVERLVALLLDTPDSEALVSPIPAGVTLTSWALEDEGTLRLHFSEGYGGLSGIDLTLADYCVVLTLCQLEEVSAVNVSVDSGLIPSRHYLSMNSSDVLLTALEEELAPMVTDLYFPRADGSGLGREQREVQVGGDTTRAEAVIRALMAGPETEGLTFPLPKDALLLSVVLEDGVCRVNFSKGLGAAPLAKTKEGALLLHSIVNSLCRLTGIEEVQLLIEGVIPLAFGGIATHKPLSPAYDLAVTD